MLTVPSRVNAISQLKRKLHVGQNVLLCGSGKIVPLRNPIFCFDGYSPKVDVVHHGLQWKPHERPMYVTLDNKRFDTDLLT